MSVVSGQGPVISVFSLFPMRENQIISEQQRAARDARVSDIERGPMILTGVKLDEIDHKSEAYSIR